MGGTPDCRDCGRCCTGQSDRHAPVTGDDWSRIEDGAPEGEAQGRWVRWTENQAFMGMQAGRCGALVAIGGRFSCAIYDRRPEVCRALAPGSSACTTEIERKGEASHRHLALLRA